MENIFLTTVHAEKDLVCKKTHGTCKGRRSRAQIGSRRHEAQHGNGKEKIPMNSILRCRHMVINAPEDNESNEAQNQDGSERGCLPQKFFNPRSRSTAASSL